MKCETLMKNMNEDNDEKKRYEHQTIPMQQSILQLEEAAEKMQQSVDELKPFEVNIIRIYTFAKYIFYFKIFTAKIKYLIFIYAYTLVFRK